MRLWQRCEVLFKIKHPYSYEKQQCIQLPPCCCRWARPKKFYECHRHSSTVIHELTFFSKKRPMFAYILGALAMNTGNKYFQNLKRKQDCLASSTMGLEGRNIQKPAGGGGWAPSAPTPRKKKNPPPRRGILCAWVAVSNFPRVSDTSHLIL